MNAMNLLLKLTALIEIPTGLAFLLAPVVVVRLLLGAVLTGPGIPLGRVAGCALLALGVACLRAGGDPANRAVRGLVAAMLLYNSGVAATLLVVGLTSPPAVALLWIAVVLHTLLAGWCLLARRGHA